MGLDVELIQVDQIGTRRRREAQLVLVGDPSGFFADVLTRVQHGGRTPMLSRLDPYGTCELTSVEMPQLLSELDERERVADAGEQKVVEAVRIVAEWCRDDPDLRLRFLGD